MAKQENFEELAGAIQNSFLQCNALAERQHIEMISEYFDSDNKPVTIPVNLPHFDEFGNVKYKSVSIPKLCLVPISSLKLEEIKVHFKVRLAGKVALQEKKEESKKRHSFLGYVQNGGQKREPKSFADITMKFASQMPPEGIMRIQDELVKVTL